LRWDNYFLLTQGSFVQRIILCAFLQQVATGCFVSMRQIALEEELNPAARQCAFSDLDSSTALLGEE
jgi:hypothetical protein